MAKRKTVDDVLASADSISQRLIGMYPESVVYDDDSIDRESTIYNIAENVHNDFTPKEEIDVFGRMFDDTDDAYDFIDKYLSSNIMAFCVERIVNGCDFNDEN